MLRLDDGFFVEYVHIAHRSTVVRVGERVAAGQELCKSGNVGFCPVPHLHIQAHASKDERACTVPFAFWLPASTSADVDPPRDDARRVFFPEAGMRYP